MKNFTNFRGGTRFTPWEVDARRFGIDPSAVLDSTAGIQAALDAANDLLQAQQDQGLSGTCNVRLGGGTFRITSQITVPNGCTLIGETKNPPYPNRDSGFGSNDNRFTGTEIVCDGSFVGENAILLAPDNTGVENLILDGHAINNGTVWPNIITVTAQGRRTTTSSIKLPINDEDDFRIQGLAIDNIEIPFFLVGANMHFQLQALGGDGNYTFTIPVGNLPAGLSMTPQGLITGTATALTTVFPTFRVTDGLGATSERVFQMSTIIDEIATRTINPATAEEASYSFQLESRYGATGLVWSALELPEWLSISSTGELTNNRPIDNNDVGFFTFKVIISDGAGNELDKRAYTSEVRFRDGAIRIFGEGTQRPQIGTAFSAQYLASGGYGDYTWSINVTRSNNEANNDEVVTATSPYPGLTLNTTTGEISGTTTTLGRNVYYLRATSNVDNAIFFEGQFIIESEEVGITPQQITRSLASGQKGVPYSFQFEMEQDAASLPYTYSASNLPSGLTIDSTTGLISGTPTGANYVNGIRIQWSCSIRNCAIRGFDAGAGIYSFMPSNVHRIHRTMISSCDQGIYFQNQTFDSHFSDLYIFNCRVGMDLGPGAAGLTTSDTRIEFIHEDGVKMNTANENDFSNIYFDTCGWSSVSAFNSLNAVFTGCRFFRSGRLVRGVGTQLNPQANRRYSNHVFLDSCKRFTFSGNSFDIGSRDGGDQIFLTNHPADNLRPTVGFRLRNAQELTVSGNNLTGVVREAFDADLTNFGQNTFKGWRIGDNAQSDRQLFGIDIKTEKETLYTPNQSFKVWQRDTNFLIPSGANQNAFPVADYWEVVRGADSVIDQEIQVNRGTDGIIETDGFYINIQKPLNTTVAPVSNLQVFELVNNSSESLKLLNDKAIIMSFWARSANNNTIQPRISQYADSPDNGFAALQQSGGDITLTTQWVRYQVQFDLADLTGIELGDNNIFAMAIGLTRFDEAYDVDITGFQVDTALQAPFAQKLRSGSFEDELAFAQLRYQKSKAYEQFLPSWVDSLRYDVNGSNFQPGYVVSYAPLNDGGATRADVVFDVAIADSPGFADQQSGVIDGIKVLNPNRLTDRVAADKYTLNSSFNDVDAYIEQVSRKHFTVSARNQTTAIGENYVFHWIYTNYPSDLNAGGGYG